MRPRASTVAATLALVACATLAGCLGDGLTVEPVALDAPVAPDLHRLVLQVTDEPGGPPLEGAYLLDAWRDGASFTSGADGRLAVDVSPERAISLRVTREGHTIELLTGIPSGPAGEQTEIVVPLYRASALIPLNGTLTLAGASTNRASDTYTTWQPQELVFGRPEAQDGYLARLIDLRAELTWVNGPAGTGDLAIGFGRSISQGDIIRDSGDVTQHAPGEKTEIGIVAFREIYEEGWRADDVLHVGPAAGTAFVAPLGIGWHLEVHATFDGALDRAPVPGPGLLLALVALAGATVAMRRR